jgi:hypothetical protein
MELSAYSLDQIALGPEGCVNGMRVKLQHPDHLLCSLDLEATLEGGALRVTSASGFFNDCPGYTGEAFGILSPEPGEPLEVDVTFAGAACTTSGSLRCARGTFDLFFHGAIGTVTFEESHLLLDGMWCGSTSGSCPTPG